MPAVLVGRREDILHAVRNATNLKVFFRIKDPREAADHAETAIPLDLEVPLAASIRPTSVGVERVKLASESTTEQESRTDSHAETDAESYAETLSYLDSHAKAVAHSAIRGASGSHSRRESFGGAP